MSKPRKDQPLKMPRYRGGSEALSQFIVDNLQYPKEALDHKVEGTVEAAYDVDGRGRVMNARILSGLGHGCDEEVIRLVNLLVFETAVNPGRNVTMHKTLKVNFKLPVKEPVGKQIQYHYVAKPKQAAEKPKPKKSNRRYVITVTTKK